MFKRSPVIMILLLNLLHLITCDEVEDDLKQQISNLSNLTGSCSEYFRYQLIDGNFINGNLTLPQMVTGDTVKITFDNLRSKETYSRGILLPSGSSQEVIKRLQKKQPISYHVGFPVMDDVPELLQIFINDKELCDGKLISRGNITILTLEHTLSIRNGFMEVFTYNINIPQFAEATNEPCGLVDRQIATFGSTPLASGGKLINRGEYPWLVYEKNSRGISFICGGSLVTSKIILSAAHCFEPISYNPEKITTMLGRHNLTNFSEDGYTTRDIERIILHSDYKYRVGFSGADLALLVMKEHVSFTKFIKPICLWRGSADENQIVNQTGVVVGWGTDKDGKRVSNVPKKIHMKIVSEVVCMHSSIGFNAITSPRTLCAGNRDGSGPYEGDSGTALMINRNGIWMVRGVTSVSLLDKDGCKLYEYTVYCDVAKHMPWLQNYTKLQEPLVTGSLDDICGISNSETHTEHPWLAAIYKYFVTGELFFCTGSIVSSRSVLVPASCFINEELLQFRRIRVYLGRYDLSGMNEKGAVSRRVESLIFQRKRLNRPYNNIALLQMKEPVRFTQYIKPICLWSTPRNESQNLKQNVTLSGWILSDVRKEISTVPKSTEINSSVVECYMVADDTTFFPEPCISLHSVVNSTGRILMQKRNERWLLLRGCENYTVRENTCSLIYYHLATTMSWIRRNMLS